MTNPDNVGGLLPCPFCGSRDISDGEMLTEKDDGTRVTQSQCRGCGAFGPEAVTDGPDYGDVRAIAAWSRRELCRAAPAGGDVAVGEIGELGGKVIVLYSQDEIGDLPKGTKLYARPQDSAPAGSGEVEAIAAEIDACAARYVTAADMQDWSRRLRALLRKLQQGADYVMVPVAFKPGDRVEWRDNFSRWHAAKMVMVSATDSGATIYSARLHDGVEAMYYTADRFRVSSQGKEGSNG